MSSWLYTHDVPLYQQYLPPCPDILVALHFTPPSPFKKHPKWCNLNKSLKKAGHTNAQDIQSWMVDSWNLPPQLAKAKNYSHTNRHPWKDRDVFPGGYSDDISRFSHIFLIHLGFSIYNKKHHELAAIPGLAIPGPSHFRWKFHWVPNECHTNTSDATQEAGLNLAGGWICSENPGKIGVKTPSMEGLIGKSVYKWWSFPASHQADYQRVCTGDGYSS